MPFPKLKNKNYKTVYLTWLLGYNLRPAWFSFPYSWDSEFSKAVRHIFDGREKCPSVVVLARASAPPRRVQGERKYGRSGCSSCRSELRVRGANGNPAQPGSTLRSSVAKDPTKTVQAQLEGFP
jgi:hypothetical protein